MKRELVYLAGPITKNNRNLNFYQACEAQIRLMRTGEYSCYNPILSMANFENSNVSWEEWLECDESWIRVSDLLLRLPGESKGADREVAYAISIGVPVVTVDYFECLRDLFTHEGDPTESIAMCLHESKRAT